MRRMLVLIFVFLMFVAPSVVMGQKKKAPKAKTDPTLTLSKKSKKVKKKMTKGKKKKKSKRASDIHKGGKISAVVVPIRREDEFLLLI